MEDQSEEITRIRVILKDNPKGITIEEISKKLPLNRTSTAKYLNTLLISGQAEMRTFGRAKVFTLSQRVPFSQMLNLSSDLLLVLDQNLNIMQVNEPFAKMFGIPSDALVGSPFEGSKLLHELSEKYMPLIRETLSGTENIKMDQIQINGEEFFFKIKLIPIVFDQGGQGLAIILEDLTELKKYQQHLEQQVYERTKDLILANEQLHNEIEERKKSQIALVQSEKKYRELVENANSIILRVDDQGIITFFNEFAEQFFGVLESEMLGKNIFGHIIPLKNDSQQELEESVTAFLKPTEHLTFNEVECLSRKGGYAWVAWTNKAIYTADGEISEHLIVGTDITERKQVENALHQVNANLNLVSSIARHDILNKLTAVYGGLALLRAHITDASLLGYLDKSENAMDAIKNQIEFTRDYKDMGMEKADWQDIDQTLNAVLEKQDLKEVKLDSRLKGLEIFADPWLKKVFSNLIDSIVRYGPETKLIHGFSHETEEGLDLFFTGDNGGIQQDQKEKIFERGYDNHNGYGLFIAREILAITGISIRENGEPDKGTRFEIKVPKRAYRFEKD
jgi:PAS domain S-box-containing protein